MDVNRNYLSNIGTEGLAAVSQQQQQQQQQQQRQQQPQPQSSSEASVRDSAYRNTDTSTSLQKEAQSEIHSSDKQQMLNANNEEVPGRKLLSASSIGTSI